MKSIYFGLVIHKPGNRICDTFDIKSNYFDPVRPKKVKKSEKLDKKVIKCKKGASIHTFAE